jgi:hypothetical protein
MKNRKAAHFMQPKKEPVPVENVAWDHSNQPDVHDANYFLFESGYLCVTMRLIEDENGAQIVMCKKNDPEAKPGLICFTTRAEAQSYVDATDSRIQVRYLDLEDRLELFRGMKEGIDTKFLCIMGNGSHAEALNGQDQTAQIPMTFLFIDELISEGVVDKVKTGAKGGKVRRGRRRVGKR